MPSAIRVPVINPMFPACDPAANSYPRTFGGTNAQLFDCDGALYGLLYGASSEACCTGGSGCMGKGKGPARGKLAGLVLVLEWMAGLAML